MPEQKADAMINKNMSIGSFFIITDGENVQGVRPFCAIFCFLVLFGLVIIFVSLSFELYDAIYANWLASK